MKFTQPRLPYSPDAISTAISPVTIDFHYGKHEKAYIDTLNSLIGGTEYEDMSLQEIIINSEGKLFNQASQAWNHILYFFQFSGNGKRVPDGLLGKKIEEQFGSFDEFKKKFEDAGMTLFGSGWVWLSSDGEGSLFITQGSNAENPLKAGLKPIMVFDVWEHAYYLDYQNRRGEYLGKLWEILDWDIIAERYESKNNDEKA